MNTKRPMGVILTLVFALALQACGAVNPQLPEQPTFEPTLPAITDTPAQTAEVPSEDSGLCSNPLYPVKQGATWTYNSTGSLSGGFNFTDTITEVREDGFTVTTQSGGSSADQEWTCKPEGLAALTFGVGAAGGLSTSGVQMDLTTTNVQGVILPKAINSGDQWPYSLDLDGKMEYGGTSVDTQGTASFNFSTTEEESVTVPAGTFNATKIHTDLKLEMQVTYSGFTAPAVFTIPSDIWYAPGVGWVKATSSGDIFGMPFNETIELQSYSIP